MPLTVLMAQPFPEPLLDQLRAVSPEIAVRRPTEGDDYTDVDVLYCMRMPDGVKSAPRLKWIQLHAAGVNGVTEHPVFNPDVMQVTNASGIHATAVAEFAVTAMLALAHRIPRIVQTQARAEWASEQERRGPLMPAPVRGATLAILGYGSIGREVARLLKPFGMRIAVTKRDISQKADTGYNRPGVGDPEGLLPDEWVPMDRLAHLLSEADFVVNCLPLTPETKGVVDEACIAGMKATALLVNVGRGATIDEGALTRALSEGRIAGAALDVFNQEPLPATSPLWKLDNLLLSPHISGFMPGHNELVTELFAENLRRYLNGRPLLNVVDPKRGY